MCPINWKTIKNFVDKTNEYHKNLGLWYSKISFYPISLSTFEGKMNYMNYLQSAGLSFFNYIQKTIDKKLDPNMRQSQRIQLQKRIEYGEGLIKVMSEYKKEIQGKTERESFKEVIDQTKANLENFKIEVNALMEKMKK